METAYFYTPLGITKIIGDEHGITEISIGHDDVAPTGHIPQILEKAVVEMEQYFKGIRKDFTFKLNPQGTEFQQKVWTELLKVPFGKTLSYLELSKRLGDVKAIRAVAAANGKNPLWIVIPCHRIIGSNGSLTGYAGGLWRKQWLLEHEQEEKQQTLF
ncbi:methylated-DNA--[protein]-cysteine S-methyltransferase [Flavobacterium sp. NRK F10]|uniref:Methylated-DNA--protein-cysteine methyltransferase n=1 Tax=Flavobacterium sediminis TaxID=2201181 RepID=A0A2U8QUC6_9FLAO|nr:MULTISPECIES: methylated-DNA--[protein]-cysteine S-methyltransferase [Flavobacterium]AWM13691.1 cysteine methyltransferase [Flavobacterium sediminis]MCO6174820.1 methylated-DNA--[protein]-cysteine S-methyltransferase [Flavobacterium sp. NRK F10]